MQTPHSLRGGAASLALLCQAVLLDRLLQRDGLLPGDPGEVDLGRGVDDPARRVDEHPLALAVAGREHRLLDVATLGADPGDEERQLGHALPDGGRLEGARCPHHHEAVAGGVPLVGDVAGHALVERQGVFAQQVEPLLGRHVFGASARVALAGEEILELAAPLVRGAREHDDALVLVRQEGVDRFLAGVRVHRDRVGGAALEDEPSVLLVRLPDVPELAVEDDRHTGRSGVDVLANELEHLDPHVAIGQIEGQVRLVGRRHVLGLEDNVDEEAHERVVDLTLVRTPLALEEQVRGQPLYDRVEPDADELALGPLGPEHFHEIQQFWPLFRLGC